MPPLILRKHAKGIDRTVAPSELANGQYVKLENLWPSEEALKARPGQELYLTVLHPSEPGRGLALVQKGLAAEGNLTSSGARSPLVVTSQSTDSGGTIGWPDPGNARISDDLYARASGPTDETVVVTHFLRARNFGFSIPAGAVILGIKVHIKGHASATASNLASPFVEVRDRRISLVRGGSIETPSRTAKPKWPIGPPDVVFEHGGALDLWGAEWTPAEINDPQFGVVIQVTLKGKLVFTYDDSGHRTVVTAGARANIDHVTITVYYATAPVPPPSGAMEMLFQVGTALYSDRTGSWTQVNAGNPLFAAGQLEAVTWKNKVFIQDGASGPWVYDPIAGTFGQWTSTENGPPVARYMLLDKERLYAAYTRLKPTEIRICHLGDPYTWQEAARPGGDEGTTLYAGQDDGDFITGLKRWGTWKVILKRRSIWRLTGDRGDNWDLKMVLPFGCVSNRLAVDCGETFVWTDGRKVYALRADGLDVNFGRPIEPFLEETPDSEWDRLAAAYWRGVLLLWYRPTSLVIYDFRHRAWFGPWLNVPANAVVVDADGDRIWLSHGTRASVTKIDGNAATDFGDAIAWAAESKHYSLGMDTEMLARSLSVLADGGVGSVTFGLMLDGTASPVGTLAFSGSGIRRLGRPIPQGRKGVHIGLTLAGVGRGGKVYELSLITHRLRRAL